MSGGGGTTYQTTSLPSGVENTLNSAAQRIGGMHSLNDIAQYNLSAPQGVAQWNQWEQAGADYRNAGTQTPWAETTLYNYMARTPEYAAQTPGSFYNAAYARPTASEQSLGYLPYLDYYSSYVPQTFFQGTTGQEQEAAWAARNAQLQGMMGVSAYNPVLANAQQVPEQFANIRQDMDLRAQMLAPTGANLATSPSLAAARQAFTTAIQPQIENQAAVAGLGRSTALTNATAQAEAQYMLPVIENELSREFQANQMRYQTMSQLGLEKALANERAVSRGMEVGLQQAQAQQQLPQTFLASAEMLSQLGQQDTARLLAQAQAEERGTVRRTQSIETAIATLQAQGQQDLARQLELATAEERALSRGTEATLATYNPLLAAGGAQTAREQEAYNRLLALGTQQRTIEQQQLDAQYNDYLRRQALSEQAIYAPFGQAPSAYGSIVRQSGGGGLFK